MHPFQFLTTLLSYSITHILYNAALIISHRHVHILDHRTLRLRDGLTPNEGRVEIKHNGKWGTICDDAWDLRDANVACRQMGYPGALSAPMRAAFGAGSGGISLSLFGCSGVENSLQSCFHSAWGATLCEHYEDASVVCRTNDTMAPRAG